MGMREALRHRGLVRPRRGRVIGGVCVGLGRWLDLNPWLVRLAAVLSIFVPGPQVLAYVLLWIVLPEE
jgi:phage shock protein C